MKKGILIPFFNEISIEDRLTIIKKVGFDNILLSLDRNYEEHIGRIEDIISLCKKLNLGISSAHASYKEPDVQHFWLDDEIGNFYEKKYLSEIEFANKYNLKVVVFHLNAIKEYDYTLVGLNRLKNMVHLAEKYNIKIAIENLYNENELEFIFNNIKSENIGMCYDCGHEFIFTRKANYLEKFASKIFAVHLHDNDGVSDLHQIPFTNKLDWQKVAKGLEKVKLKSLDGEIKLKHSDNEKVITKAEFYEIMKKCYESLKKLDEKVLEL